MHVAVASYCIAVAALMGLWWGIEIRNGALNRPDRSRGEIALHLTAECLTALILAIGGIVLARGGPPSLALVGLGMLLYPVIQSPGYFLATLSDQGQRTPALRSISSELASLPSCGSGDGSTY